MNEDGERGFGRLLLGLVIGGAVAAKGDVTPVGARTQHTVPSCDYDDPADVDRRLRELAKEKGIK